MTPPLFTSEVKSSNFEHLFFFLPSSYHVPYFPGLENQEAIFKDLLRDFPSVLISNYGQKHEEELTQTVCEIRQNLEVHLANSEQEKVRI